MIQGLAILSLSVFCGFLITEENFPSFWLFMYWLNPLHYALEGIISAMFRDDDTVITLLTGESSSAERYVHDIYFTTWKYERIGYDLLALWLLSAGLV